MKISMPQLRRLILSAPAVLILLPLLTGGARAQVPDPTAFFGVTPGTSGELITWDRLVDYYRAVADASPRVEFNIVGEATEGAPFVMVLISSADNIARSDEFLAIQQKLADPRTWADAAEKERLIDEGRVIVMQNCGIHATEVGTYQAPPLLVYELATSNTAEIMRILDESILVLIPSHNPDGAVKVTEWWNTHKGEPWQSRLPFLYQKYAGHDNNRDWYTFFQKESQLTLEVHNQWHPQVVIDQHQMGSGGARIFVPPFEDPVEPNVDPVLISWLGSIGPFVGAYFNARNIPGVEWGVRYDAWSPARAYHHYKGGIRVLTEVASGDWADPVFVSPERLSGNYSTMRSNFTDPWPGGEWTFEDIVKYNYLSSKALILFAANNRRQLLEGFASYHERSLAYKDSPGAFIIPGDQDNLFEVGEMLDILNRAQVEIQISRSRFTADGREYGSGSYLIEIAQPYGRFAKAVMERQEYPDLRLFEGGPPDPPYDVTGNTLPLLMGVEAIPVDSWEGGLFTDILAEPEATTRPQGGIVSDSGRWLAFSGANTGSIIAANRLRARNIPVFWTTRPFEWRDKTWPAGTILVRNNNTGRGALMEMVEELSIWAIPLSPRPALDNEDMIPMGKGRVGLIQSWFASIEAGWTEWVLEHYDFNYTIVRPADLADGQILSELDAIIVPGENARAVIRGHAEGEMPSEYVGGAEAAGLQNLRDFVEAGGAVLAWGGGLNWVADAFEINVTNALAGLPATEYSIPGSILRGRFDTTLPVNYGLQTEDGLWFRRNMALLFEDPAVITLARYGSNDLLMSGYALGAEYLHDKVAAGGAVRGKGAVILFGFTPQYRAQSRNTMKMLFNTILGAGNPMGAARLLRDRP